MPAWACSTAACAGKRPRGPETGQHPYWRGTQLDVGPGDEEAGLSRLKGRFGLTDMGHKISGINFDERIAHIDGPDYRGCEQL